MSDPLRFVIWHSIKVVEALAHMPMSDDLARGCLMIARCSRPKSPCSVIK